MNTETASQLIYEALAAAASGNTETAFDKFNAVCENADVPCMYGVCCALAEAGTHMIRQIYGDKAPASPEEGMFVLQELQPGAVGDDPAKAFSVRFLTAWANGDRDTTDALFAAATRASNEEFIDSVCALFADAVGLIRLAAAEREEPK